MMTMDIKKAIGSLLRMSSRMVERDYPKVSRIILKIMSWLLAIEYPPQDPGNKEYDQQKLLEIRDAIWEELDE